MAMIKCKECGAPVSTKADKCPRCGAPVKSKGSGCLAVVVTIFGLSLIGSILNSNVPSNGITSNSTKNIEPEIDPSATNAFEACSRAQKYVKQQLKSPRSAKFPSCYENQITELKGNLWLVSGTVDADNSFGTSIRNQYAALMKYTPESRSWSLSSIEIK